MSTSKCTSRRKSRTPRKNNININSLAVNPYSVLWIPPVSPYGLLEEELYADPWKLLIGCMLLNKTSAAQVRGVIWKFFARWPDAHSAMEADVDLITRIIQPLGLAKKRALYIKRFSREYLHKPWKDPSDLTGLGKYASDAYFIFCKGLWEDVDPSDKELRRYIEWLRLTNGNGNGCER